MQYLLGSSRSSEPTKRGLESRVKINSLATEMKMLSADLTVLGRFFFFFFFFPINNAALPQEYVFFKKMCMGRLGGAVG